MSEIIFGNCDNCGLETSLLTPYGNGYWCKHCKLQNEDIQNTKHIKDDYAQFRKFMQKCRY